MGAQFFCNYIFLQSVILVFGINLTFLVFIVNYYFSIQAVFAMASNFVFSSIKYLSPFSPTKLSNL